MKDQQDNFLNYIYAGVQGRRTKDVLIGKHSFDGIPKGPAGDYGADKTYRLIFFYDKTRIVDLQKDVVHL